MRPCKMEKELLYLFSSKVRVEILRLFFSHPGETIYVRRLGREIKEQINAVRRELKRLNSIGLLKKEKRANRLYYGLKKDFLFYPELLRMMGKTVGLGGVVTENFALLGRVKYAVLSIPYLMGRQSKKNEIDLLLVGRFNQETLKSIIASYEKKEDKEVNYTVMTEDEFAFRKKRRDPFIEGILLQPQVVLAGDEEEINKWG